MRYYCEDIISISLVWKQIINETKKSKVLNFGGTIFQGNKMGLQIEQKKCFSFVLGCIWKVQHIPDAFKYPTRCMNELHT